MKYFKAKFNKVTCLVKTIKQTASLQKIDVEI